MHICGDKLTNIDSDDLSPGWRQAIIWTNAGILLIGPLGTNLSEILTHWGWVTHMCVNTLTIIGSDNGLAPGHYLNQWWDIANWALGNKFQCFLTQNLHFFIHENAFENVWKMASILSRPQCVNRNSCIFIQENAFENLVWEMMAILSQPQYGKSKNSWIFTR